MKNSNLFAPDNDTKNLIKEVSTLFGIKADIVTELLHYVLFTWLLQLSKNPEKLQSICLPYIGKLGIRFKGDYIDNASGDMKSEIDTFISLNDNFKQMLSDINDRDISSLVDYLKTDYINKLVEDSLQS